MIIFTAFFAVVIISLILANNILNNQASNVNQDPAIDSFLEYMGETKPKQQENIIPIYIWIMPGVMYLLGFVVSLIMFINGLRSERVKKLGKLSKCKVFNIASSRRFTSMVVEYKSESGAIRKLSVPLTFSQIALFKPDMVIECYVLGEDCYVDMKNIKEIKTID